MRRAFVAVMLLCALALAACGGPAAVTPVRGVAPPAPVPVAPPSPTSPGPCIPEEWSMQCGLQGQQNDLLHAAPLRTTVLASGIDFGWGGPSVTWLRGVHAGFAASYYSYDSSKNWGAGQVASYHAGGIATVGVWESTAARALGGFAAGASDARQARAEAAAVGEPRSRPIYFAVDFDSTGYGCAICGYFQGADSVLGVAHVGGYGGLVTMQTLFGQHLITYGWQTYAWSRGLWDGRAQLQQYLNGSTVDWDRAVAKDYGQWPFRAPLLPLCYSHRTTVGQCAAAKARVAKFSEGKRVDAWRLWWTRSHLQRWHCRPHPRRHACVRLERQRSALTFNVRWLSSHVQEAIKTH